MKREIKTDNVLTKVVLDASEFITQLKKEVREQYKVPFMHREKTRSDRRRNT